MIQKTVKCPTHGVDVTFDIDLENEEIKDKIIFTLTRTYKYEQKNYILQVTFDQQLNARRVNCFDIQEPEAELLKRAKHAEIQTYLENVKNKDQYSNWSVIFCGSVRFPLVDYIHNLICSSITYYKRNEFVEVLDKLKFTSVEAPSPPALKRIIRRQELRGILLIVNPKGNIIEYIKSATMFSPDNLCIGICPVDREGKIDIRQFIVDISGNFLSHRKPNQSFGFWRLDPSTPTSTTQDVLSWVMGFE
ncbi:MAG: hypothetical protein ACFFCZ_23455 [Promethearchaeota archaeon]